MARRRTTKQTTTKQARKTAGARPAPRARRPARPALPPPSLRLELLAMARGGARWLLGLGVTLFVLAGLAGLGAGVWSLRPTPVFSSEAAEEGSPFDTLFKAENTSTWLPLANLKLSCVLAHVRAAGIEPTIVEAEAVTLPAGPAAAEIRGLPPGGTATFRCPFRALIGHPINQDVEVAKRAEIYFRATYDVPLLRPLLGESFAFLRIPDDSGHFFLDRRLLPPRWVPVAGAKR